LDAKQPLIRIGSGFMKLSRQQPDRARYEIARVIAQTWAPCELKVAGASQGETLWNPLLACLGMSGGDKGCVAGSSSEAGWAVSSTLAMTLANPGCTIPAFKEVAQAECWKKIPLAPKTAAVSRAPSKEIKND
jgi:hypothetical protein